MKIFTWFLQPSIEHAVSYCLLSVGFNYIVSTFKDNSFDLVIFLFVFCEGTQMAQSRYLFAFSCFHMDLLNEAEKALSPANESGLEVIPPLMLN